MMQTNKCMSALTVTWSVEEMFEIDDQMLSCEKDVHYPFFKQEWSVKCYLSTDWLLS